MNTNGIHPREHLHVQEIKETENVVKYVQS